jgi:hypothetical protein
MLLPMVIEPRSWAPKCLVTARQAVRQPDVIAVRGISRETHLGK